MKNAGCVYKRAALALYVGAVSVALSGCSGIPEGLGILIPKPAEYFPTLVAFIVIFFILSKFAWPMVVSALDERQKKIEGALEEAAAAKKEAEDQLQDNEKLVEEARAKAEAIISEAEDNANTEAERIISAAKQEAANTLKQAREQVEHEREVAMRDISNEVVDLSVEIATKIIGDSLDEDGQRRLAERYLDEVDNIDGNSSS